MTWEKDSHGLFDYESGSITTEKYRIDNSCQIVRQDNKQIKIVDFNERIGDENSSVLAYITQKDSFQSSYFINPNNQVNNYDNNTSEGSSDALEKQNISCKDQNNNDAFLIVRFNRNQQNEQKGYALQVGDMIKLGRVEYCVIEKSTDEQGVQQQEQYNFNIDYTKPEIRTCRICLCEEEQVLDNPLLNPCNCRGSCEYMHFECLKHWVESKVQKKTTNLISTYKWKNLECEVCKQPLPKVININNQKKPLIEVQRPNGNYLILESISREKKVSKGLFIIQNLKGEEEFNQVKLVRFQYLKNIQIKGKFNCYIKEKKIYNYKNQIQQLNQKGRGHTCDIRVQDISVSRFHSYIKYENGQFLLFDNSSKFGTLVKLDKNYPILQEKVGVQIGRTVITLSLKPIIQNNINRINQFPQQTQQIIAQYDNRSQLTASKITLTTEQQQQIYAITHQLKEGNNQNMTQSCQRISTNGNMPSSSSSINSQNSISGNSCSGQNKNQISSQQQIMTSQLNISDKLNKNNQIKQQKRNELFSNGANISISNSSQGGISSSDGNSSQSGNSSQMILNISNRPNLQTVVISNGNISNFNTTQHKMNEVQIMNNYAILNSPIGNTNHSILHSSHIINQNIRNCNNNHFNDFPNFNTMIYNQNINFNSNQSSNTNNSSAQNNNNNINYNNNCFSIPFQSRNNRNNN